MSLTTQMVGPARVLDAAAVTIDQVESQAIALGNNKIVRSAGGQVFPTFGALMSQNARMSYSTSQIAAFLTKVSTKGLILASGFEMYNQLVAAATGLRAGATSHQKIACVTGMIIPRQLSCSQGGIARLTFDVFGVTAAGATNPWTITESQSLPTTAGIAQEFTLGPVKINGAQLEGVADLTIDFGIAEFIRQNDGAIYPQAIGVTEIRPRVTLRLEDAAVLATLGITGTAQGATDSVIYLRKRAANAIRTADNVAEHISFTIDSGMWTVEDKGGQHPQYVNSSVECQPIYVGTPEPLVYSGTATIS